MREYLIKQIRKLTFIKVLHSLIHSYPVYITLSLVAIIILMSLAGCGRVKNIELDYDDIYKLNNKRVTIYDW